MSVKNETKYIQSRMPTDANGKPVQVVVGNGSRVNLTAGSVTSNAALPTGTTDYVFVRCTDWIWLNFGTSGVTASVAATSILCPPGEGVYEILSTTTHVAVLRVGGTDAAVQVEAV